MASAPPPPPGGDDQSGGKRHGLYKGKRVIGGKRLVDEEQAALLTEKAGPSPKVPKLSRSARSLRKKRFEERQEAKPPAQATSSQDAGESGGVASEGQGELEPPVEDIVGPTPPLASAEPGQTADDKRYETGI